MKTALGKRLRKISFNLFETFGPFGLDFLFEFLGERGGATLRGDGHGDVFAKIHTGRHDEVAVEVITGVIDQNATGAGIVRNLRIDSRLVSADKDHEDATEVERFVRTVD